MFEIVNIYNMIMLSNRYAATIISTIFVYAAMWCWLGIGKDSTTFGSSDAIIFRNVGLIALGAG